MQNNAICAFSLGVKCLQIQNHDIKHATDIKHKFNIFFGIPRLDSIESSGFFSLLPIIIGVFWGVWTRSKRLDAVAPRYWKIKILNLCILSVTRFMCAICVQTFPQFRENAVCAARVARAARAARAPRAAHAAFSISLIRSCCWASHIVQKGVKRCNWNKIPSRTKYHSGKP